MERSGSTTAGGVPGRATLAALLLLCGSALAGEGPATGKPAPGSAPAGSARLRLHRLQAKDVLPVLVEAIESRLCQALAEASRAEVICPEDLAAVAELARQEALLGSCESEECLRRAERAGEAGVQIHGRLVKEGDGLRLTLTLTGVGGRAGQAEASLPAALEPLAKRLGPLARALLAAPAP
jgi:hypothetical protein